MSSPNFDLQNNRPASRDFPLDGREQVFYLSAVGLQWLAGEITTDDVLKKLGAPRIFRTSAEDLYYYDFSGGFCYFDIIKELDAQKKGIGRYFNIKTNGKLDIPRDLFETRLGLHKLVKGELIDGVRKERRQYFNPRKEINPVGESRIIKPGDSVVVVLSYRFPMPDDSLFDVYADVVYKPTSYQQPDQWEFEHTTKFRELSFSRDYLYPWELEDRNQKKRY